MYIGLAVLICSMMIFAEPMSTAFTYQGRLLDDNVAADGLYDMQFKLYDNPDTAIGTQIGTTIISDDVEVTDGYFIAELDFGSSAFDGQTRWLQISVCPGESTNPNDFEPLSPLQNLTPTPYALYALNGPGSSGFWSSNGNHIYNTNNGNVGIGTSSPSWELEVANLTAGDGAEVGVTANDATGAMAAYSSTLGAPFEHYGGRVSLFAGLETPGLDLRADGIAGDVRFYTGGPWPANERMRIDSNGNVGIGTSSPFAPLEVHSDDTGRFVRLNSDQTLGYMQFLEDSTPRAYLGFGDDGDILNNAEDNSFVINSLNSAMHFAVDSDAKKGITVDTNGNVGIGITNPQSKLEVDGYIKASNTPIAYAHIKYDGTVRSGTSNVSCIWNTTDIRYEITITGEDYHFPSYVTVITPSASTATIANVSSFDGKLIVFIFNLSGNKIQDDFQFITYKP
jgi:hypothetical protein